MEKRYVARRDRLRVGAGEIHTGEAFPAAELSPAVLGVGWVSEGAGTLPTDEGTHVAFSDEELAALGGTRAPKTPATPKATKARKRKTPAPK